MIRLVRYSTWKKVRGGYQSSARVAFVKPGPKWAKVVVLDAGMKSGLRVWRVRPAEQRYMRPLMRKGKPYSIPRALRIFRKFGKTHGITKGAKNLLKEASSQNA